MSNRSDASHTYSKTTSCKKVRQEAVCALRVATVIPHIVSRRRCCSGWELRTAVQPNPASLGAVRFAIVQEQHVELRRSHTLSRRSSYSQCPLSKVCLRDLRDFHMEGLVYVARGGVEIRAGGAWKGGALRCNSRFKEE
jgi:hypothetical protein